MVVLVLAIQIQELFANLPILACCCDCLCTCQAASGAGSAEDDVRRGQEYDTLLAEVQRLREENKRLNVRSSQRAVKYYLSTTSIDREKANQYCYLFMANLCG